MMLGVTLPGTVLLTYLASLFRYVNEQPSGIWVNPTVHERASNK